MHAHLVQYIASGMLGIVVPHALSHAVQAHELGLAQRRLWKKMGEAVVVRAQNTKHATLMNAQVS